MFANEFFGVVSFKNGDPTRIALSKRSEIEYSISGLMMHQYIYVYACNGKKLILLLIVKHESTAVTCPKEIIDGFRVVPADS